MPKKFTSSLYLMDQGDAWGMDGQYWVTVFGFPAASKAVIMTYFQNIGELVDTREYGGKANWIHMRYRTCLQAEKALSRDGSMIGDFMVGVKKCYSTGINNPCSLSLDSSRATPMPSRYVYISIVRSFLTPAISEYDVIDSNDTDIFLPPRRRKDICSRIAHYLFNW